MLLFTAVIKISYIFIPSNKILKCTLCLAGLVQFFLLNISWGSFLGNLPSNSFHYLCFIVSSWIAFSAGKVSSFCGKMSSSTIILALFNNLVLGTRLFPLASILISFMLYRNSISINFVSVLKFHFASLLLTFKIYFLIPAMVTIPDISNLTILHCLHGLTLWKQKSSLFPFTGRYPKNSQRNIQFP